MTGGYAGPPVCSLPASFGYCLECLDGASPVCVVPRLFEQARWCTRTSPVLVIPAKAGIHFGGPGPTDEGIPSPRGLPDAERGRTVGSCLEWFGSGRRVLWVRM